MPQIGGLLEEGIRRLRASGSESARLDAEVLLAHVLGVGRTTVLAHPESPVGPEAAGRFEAALTRREAGEPVAYIRGLKEFRGLAFVVDRRALIPRPETELLVDEAEREMVRRLTSAPRPPGTPPIRVVDVGTGSGAVAVALAVGLRRRGMLYGQVEIVATDRDDDALGLARENAVGHAVGDAIEFASANLLPGDSESSDGAGPAESGAPPVLTRRFDVILANLPYIPSGEIERLPIAASFEPRSALDGGPDGLDLIRSLISWLPGALAPGGVAFLEIGDTQAESVAASVETLPAGHPGDRDGGSWCVEVLRDLAGHPRLARIERRKA